MKPSDRDRYVRDILDHYRATPGTRGRIRNADRRLAEDLYRRGVPAHDVRAAMILAAARRTFRDPALGPLEPIGSLHYFLPIIHEIQRQSIDPDYLLHVETRLAECRSETADDDHRST